jgi:hypothetical protein
VEPIVIHMTYQRWWSGGKRARLREWGLWHIDAPEYHSASLAAPAASSAGPAGRKGYVTYENGVVQFVDAVARQRYPGDQQMPLFYKMWLAMTYQLAAFRLVNAWLPSCGLQGV